MTSYAACLEGADVMWFFDRRIKARREIALGLMEEGSDYYLVRKGETVAVYNTLNDCQAQVYSSIATYANARITLEARKGVEKKNMCSDLFCNVASVGVLHCPHSHTSPAKKLNMLLVLNDYFPSIQDLSETNALKHVLMHRDVVTAGV
ncbi:hypothetical protein ABZP36_030432 [Zizania latifolia]